MMEFFICGSGRAPQHAESMRYVLAKLDETRCVIVYVLHMRKGRLARGYTDFLRQHGIFVIEANLKLSPTQEKTSLAFQVELAVGLAEEEYLGAECALLVIGDRLEVTRALKDWANVKLTDIASATVVHLTDNTGEIVSHTVVTTFVPTSVLSSSLEARRVRTRQGRPPGPRPRSPPRRSGKR